MRIVDLTMPIPLTQKERTHPLADLHDVTTICTRIWPIGAASTAYHAQVHYFQHWGMSGTYIDFPGHIMETDNGMDAGSTPGHDLYRVPALVLRPTPAPDDRKITATMLRSTLPIDTGEPAVIINALGDLRYDEIPERSIYLSQCAAQWLADRNTRLLISDVYESTVDPQNVFPILFRNGVVTVCYPDRLSGIGSERVRVTALPNRFPGATQLPCRLIVEEGAPR